MTTLRLFLLGAGLLASAACASSNGTGESPGTPDTSDAPTAAFACTDEVDLALTLESDDVSGSLTSSATLAEDRIFLRTELGSGQGDVATDAEFEGTFNGSPIEGFRVVLDVNGRAEVTVSHDTKAITILSGDVTFEPTAENAATFDGTLASGDGSIETAVTGQATC